MKKITFTLEYDSRANMAYMEFSPAEPDEEIGPDRTVHLELPSWARSDLEARPTSGQNEGGQVRSG